MKLILPCRADDFFIIGDKEGDAKILYPSQVQKGPEGSDGQLPAIVQEPWR